MTTEPPVLLTVPGPHVAQLAFNRPRARNAINSELALAFGTLYRQVEADSDVWVVILTGAGEEAFCAGADLKEIAAGNGEGLAQACKTFSDFIQQNNRQKPWIAAVNGFALGGGTEFALACDMIVAAENATLGLPEVKRGVMALGGGVIQLPRALPRNIALEYIATGAPITPARGYELGMVNRLAPKGGALSAALEIAAAIAENSPYCVRESLKIAREADDLTRQELWALSETARVKLQQTQDYQEGPRAFAEKRKPNWAGK